MAQTPPRPVVHRADRAWPVATLQDRRAKRQRGILQTRLQPVADTAQTGDPAHRRIVGIRVTLHHRHQVLAREGLGHCVKIPRAELDRAVKARECARAAHIDPAVQSRQRGGTGR